MPDDLPKGKNALKSFRRDLTKTILRDMMYYATGGIIWMFN